MNDLVLQLVGNLTDEVKLSTQGTPKASFSVAHTPRVRDGKDGWKDGETTFLPCEAWGTLATNIAASCTKGTRFVGIGELGTQRWTDEKSGEKRSRLVVTVTRGGPDLTFASAKVEKQRR